MDECLTEFEKWVDIHIPLPKQRTAQYTILRNKSWAAWQTAWNYPNKHWGNCQIDNPGKPIVTEEMLDDCKKINEIASQNTEEK